jgi:hypothetical protein
MIDGDQAGVIKIGKQRSGLCWVAQGGDGSLAANLATSRSSTTLASLGRMFRHPGYAPVSSGKKMIQWD